MSTSALKRALAASAAVTTVAIAGGAHAQSTQGSGEPRLEEIIVTADRTGTEAVQVGSFRGAKVLDTPLTISVIPRDLLEAQQARDLFDALRNTPGVTSAQTSPTVYNNLSIRGIPVENRGNYRLNGSLPIVNLIDLPLENKERVEALKGASALYYGFTTPSGIINLTTKQPTADPVFYTALNANDHGQLQGHIDAGARAGIFGARGNFAFGNIESGIERTSGWRSFQSLALQLDPADFIRINVDGEHIYKKVTEPTVLRGPTSGTLLTQLPALADPRRNPGSEGFMNVAEAYNLLGRVAVKFSPAWSLTVEGGISNLDRDRRFSTLNFRNNAEAVSGTGLLTATAVDGQLYRNKNGRVELAGTFATGPVVHELLVGASKNIRRQYSPTTINIATTGAAGNCATLLGLPSTCLQNAYNPTPVRKVIFAAPQAYQPTRDSSIHDTGFYAFDRAKFGGPEGDLISVLLGARKSIYRERTKTAAGGETTSFADEPWSFSGGLVVKPLRTLSVYGTYIEGLESTPAAPLTAVNAGQQLPATSSTQWEGGIKYEPKNNLLFQAAYFDIKRSLTLVNASNVYVQDGEARYKGFEFSLSGKVTPDLSVYASALFLRAKQGLTQDPTLIGKRIENVPETQWSVSAEYRLTPVLPGLAITAGAFYTGNRAINPQNTLFVPGYTLFDVGGSYSFDLGGVEMVARVYAQNVTGKRYFVSSSSNFFAYGNPPTVKFSLSAALF